MRIATTALVLFGSALAVSAQPAPAPAAGTVAYMQTFDVPMTGRPQTVFILKRVFKPNEDIGMHTHQGTEITQVLYGTIELATRGKGSKTYKAGESFIIPRGDVHNPINAGTDEAAVAVTYVLDKSAPMRDPVPGPATRY